MIIQCPNCSEKVAVKGLGRKPLNIPLKNIYECLRKYRSVARVAQELGCSKGYIYNVLKDNGLKGIDILTGVGLQKTVKADSAGNHSLSRGK